MSIPPYREQLGELLRIPSISTDGEHTHDLRRAAGWLSTYLESLGFGTSLVETDGPPLLLAELRSAGAGRPTVLIYGHYDVQPPDPVEAWTSHPFEPTVRDGRLYARGATDDKGQLLIQLKAIEALAAARGGLPVNIVVLVEGEEEVGSGGALRWVREHGGEVGADAVLVSDSNLWSEDRPAIITGFRGITYLEVRVVGPARDLHSGVYGGAVVNPVNALVRMLAGLQHDDWRVNAPGFYDPVLPLDDEHRSRLPSDLDEARLVEETGVPALGGEASFSLAERLWYRPTLDVNGIVGGFGGDGVKTVIPAAATAKLSSRLVPGQRPDSVSRILESRLRELAPEEVRVEVDVLSAAEPWRARTDHFAYHLAGEALSEVFPEPAVFVGDGGSLPIVPALEAATGAPVIPMGFGVPGANPHAPDEWLSLEAFERGVRAVTSFHERLGAH